MTVPTWRRPKRTTAPPWPLPAPPARPPPPPPPRGLGTLYAKIGQREQARAELSSAIDLYRAMAMTFWLAQAEAALARVEGR